ncbi:MAG TPA: TPM domain-containing protein, partial [Leptospiraceae bacterium]|nr:TPM domain-containing protein [Leptospiraceae bacterium]
MTLCSRLFLLLLVFVSTSTFADELADRIAAVPNPRTTGGWVSDPSQVLATRTDAINHLISDHEKETTDEIAVVVLPSIGQLVPKEFATALFNSWKIGKAKKNNGVLVLHILDQRRIEIETGYGQEGALPDVKCKWILDEVVVP